MNLLSSADHWPGMHIGTPSNRRHPVKAIWHCIDILTGVDFRLI